MKMIIRKILSYLFDYVLLMILVSLYFFCANVFMLDSKTMGQAYIMLASVFITVLALTSYIPTIYNGQTLGQRIMKIQVVNESGKKRTYVQSFLREGLIKFTFAPIFIIVTIGYFIISNVIINHDLNGQLPFDVILKTTVNELPKNIKCKRGIAHEVI